MVSMHAVVELSSTTVTQTVDNKSMTIVLAVTLLTIATLLVLLLAFIVKTLVKGKRVERNAMAGLPDGDYSHLNRSQQSRQASHSPQQSVNNNGTVAPNTERSVATVHKGHRP